MMTAREYCDMVEVMGIRGVPTPCQTPNVNAHVERFIGTPDGKAEVYVRCDPTPKGFHELSYRVR